MLSGHNGHVAKRGSSYTNTGSLLESEYGDEYYVIGTDFYNTLCNIADGGGRGNHSLCSKDPLAAQLKNTGENMLWLDFASVPSGSEVERVISEPMKMGSLGEAYAWYMKLLPMSYTIEAAPSELYDGMIFVYDATPTEVPESSSGELEATKSALLRQARILS